MTRTQTIKNTQRVSKTADSGVIAYSQVGAKIYYRFSDIEDLLNKNHIKAKEKHENRKTNSRFRHYRKGNMPNNTNTTLSRLHII